MHWLDPAHLPETKGLLDRFLINSHGDADGLLLQDGKEIHFPPHMGKAVVAAFKFGEMITVHGVRPRGVDMISAVSLQAGDAAPVVDHGPPREEDDEKKRSHEKAEKTASPEPLKSADTEGVVRRVLHGAKGEKRGALLDNGTIVRMPPHVAAALGERLSPEHKLAARGPSLTNALGTVVDAQEIGVSLSALHALEPRKGLERKEAKSAEREEKPKKRERPM